MSALLPYLVVGVVLLALIAFLVRRSMQPVLHTAEFSGMQEAVAALRANLLPPELVDRIFSREDLEFVGSHCGRGVVEMLEQERMAIAISWLLATRRQVTKLMTFHLTQARLHSKIRFRMEMGLAVEYLSLYAAFELFMFLVWLRGPFHARKMVGPIVGMAAQICTVYGELIGDLEFKRPSRTQAPPSSARIVG